MGNNQSVPNPTQAPDPVITSVPTLKSYTSLLLPDEASFFKALRQRKIYDIQNRVDKSVDLIGAPPELTGQSSVVSDQGTELTCSSHAVGKAIVEIIDGFTMDCDQDKIIEDLIKTVQPGRQATYIQEFANNSIEVEI